MITKCQASEFKAAVLTSPSYLFDEKWEIPHWYAVYTRSRHEKILNRELNQRQIESFLPVRKVLRDWSDRKKTIEEPLFKGYLFVRMPLKRRWDVLNSVGAVRLVGRSNADPVSLCEEEILSVRRFMEEKVCADPFPYLREGDRVFVKSGPLKGIEGFIVRKDEHCRLVLSLDLIMQSISVQIDGACVEKI